MGGSDQEKNESFDRAYDMLHTILSFDHEPAQIFILRNVKKETYAIYDMSNLYNI